MRLVRSLGLTVAVLVGLVGVAVTAPAPKAPSGPSSSAPPADPHAMAGWDLYDRYCLACHGVAGDGQGPAAPYNWGAARSFVAGEYKWRSAAIGQPPTDDDLKTTI